jgi:DHA2 family methylenomycin A resistance protein-like MFS transporter
MSVPSERSDEPAPRWGLLAATSLGFAVVQLDVSVVNVAIKPIGVTLGGGVSALQWVVSAYTITFAALILTAGTLGDRIGARRVYLAGFAVFIVASLACGAAPSLGVLIGARAMQGIGAAVLVPCSLTLLNHAHPDARQRGRAIGIWAAGASVALSGGPLIGGALIAAIDWRAIFLINVPIGLLGVVLTLRHAADTPRSGSRAVDIPGQLTAILGLALLAGSVIEGGATSFRSWPILAGLLAALLLAGAFVLIEHRRREPMLPLGLFRIPTFRDAASIGVLINIAFYGLIFVLSLFFQRAQGRSPLQTGLAFAPMTAIVMGANVMAGRASSGRAARPTLILGAALLAAGSLSLLGTGPGSAYAALVAPLMAIGFGLGLIVPIITSALLGSVDSSRSGLAAGTLNTARQAGSVLGVAVLGSLAGSGLTHGLHVALIITAAIAISVILLGVRLRLAPPDTPR